MKQTAFLLALFGAASLASAATVIHVDFGSGTNFSGSPNSVLDDAAVTTDKWNYFSPNAGSGTFTPLVDSANQSTGVTLGWTTPSSSLGNWNVGGSNTYSALLGDYAYIISALSATFTFNNLVAGASYDLVLYTAATAAGASWSVTNGTTNFGTQEAAGGGNGAALTELTDYVRYSVVASSTGTLSFTMNKISGHNEANMAGLDLQMTAVPEPSVALLGSLGLMALLRRRR